MKSPFALIAAAAGALARVAARRSRQHTVAAAPSVKRSPAISLDLILRARAKRERQAAARTLNRLANPPRAKRVPLAAAA